MTSDLETLARRLLASPRFTWRSGMRYLANGNAYRLSDEDFCGPIQLPPDHIPDLSDERTIYLLRRDFTALGILAKPSEILAALEAAE